MKGQELYSFLRDVRTPWETPMVALDMDGTRYDVVSVETDEGTGELVFKIKEKM